MNVGKTVTIVFQTCCVIRNQSDAAYCRRMTVEGATYQANKKQRV